MPLYTRSRPAARLLPRSSRRRGGLSRRTRQIEARGTRWEFLARQRWPQLAARGAVSTADASARPRHGGRDGASSPAGAPASPPGLSSRTGRGAASPTGARNGARGSSGRRERSRSSCIITCKIHAKPGCAMTVHAQRSARLGEEEVVEQLLCPEMT